MHHFFIPPECFSLGRVSFPAGVARQMSAVLRLEAGQMVAALDDLGGAFLVELSEVSKNRAEGQVIEPLNLPPEPALRLTLYVSLTQREKFEFILQKCTELGVSEIVPVIYARTLAQSTREAEAKRERWQTILREAAEQCGRLRIPQLGSVLRWPEAVARASQQDGARVVLWEAEPETSLKDALGWNPAVQRAALFIGPEGGISDEEIELARQSGCKTATLGRRILRVETAVLAAVTLAMYLAGEMG